MKTQVFHYFREIGNGLIFVQLIERALNQQEMHDMIQAAPFRRQFPRIHIKEGERYESKEGFKIQFMVFITIKHILFGVFRNDFKMT